MTKTMQKPLALFCALALLCACALAAGCQPAQPAALPEGTDAAQPVGTPEPAATAQAGETDVSAFPERFACDFVGENLGAHVTADVPIRYLSETSFPQARVAPRAFTEQEVELLSRRLLGETLYAYDASQTPDGVAAAIDYNESLMESETVRERIVAEYGEDYYTDTYLPQQEEALAALRAYQRQLEAGEAPAQQTWDGSYSQQDGALRTAWLTNVPNSAAGGDAERDLVSVTNDPDHALATDFQFVSAGTYAASFWDKCGANVQNERIDPAAYGETHHGLGLTPQQAIDQVRALFDGILELSVYGVYYGNDAPTDGEYAGEWQNDGYIVRATPAYGSAGCLWLTGRSSVQTESGGDSWDHELILAAVDETGVRALTWSCPTEVLEGPSGTAAMLPFDEVERLVSQAIDRLPLGQGVAELEVTEVRLGLMRLLDGSEPEGTLTPVWAFLGSITRTDGSTKRFRDELEPLLLINAVTGDSVNLTRGY